MRPASLRFGCSPATNPGLLSGSDFYIGHGRALTGEVWYKDIGTFLIRIAAGEYQLTNQEDLASFAGKLGAEVPAADGPVEAEKAMKLLLNVPSNGFQPHPQLLIRDRGFDSLRERDDLQVLVRKFETKASASQ